MMEMQQLVMTTVMDLRANAPANALPRQRPVAKQSRSNTPSNQTSVVFASKAHCVYQPVVFASYSVFGSQQFPSQKQFYTSRMGVWKATFRFRWYLKTWCHNYTLGARVAVFGLDCLITSHLLNSRFSNILFIIEVSTEVLIEVSKSCWALWDPWLWLCGDRLVDDCVSHRPARNMLGLHELAEAQGANASMEDCWLTWASLGDGSRTCQRVWH